MIATLIRLRYSIEVDKESEPDLKTMILINFTRLFTSGTLEGLTQSDKIKFLNFELAQDWVNNYNAKDNYLIAVTTIDIDDLKETLTSALESANDAYHLLQKHWKDEPLALTKEAKLVAEINSIKLQLITLI